MSLILDPYNVDKLLCLDKETTYKLVIQDEKIKTENISKEKKKNGKFRVGVGLAESMELIASEDLIDWNKVIKKGVFETLAFRSLWTKDTIEYQLYLTEIILEKRNKNGFRSYQLFKYLKYYALQILGRINFEVKESNEILRILRKDEAHLKNLLSEAQFFLKTTIAKTNERSLIKDFLIPVLKNQIQDFEFVKKF